MDVKKMIAKKKELQEEIVFLIQNFESQTGLDITDIDMVRSYMFGPGENGMVTDINIEVRLP